MTMQMQCNGAVFCVKGEDARIHTNLPNGTTLVGVADGHGGSAAARVCRQVLNGYTAVLDDETDIKLLFARIHDTCKSLECHSGTTLTICVLHPDGSLLCANVGDSMALVITPTSHYWATVSHRLQDNAGERSLLSAAVGFAIGEEGRPVGPPRVYPGGLACSRSIGDGDCPHVSCDPSVTRAQLSPDDILVVASDGLWDAMSLSKICRVARSTRCAQSILQAQDKNAFRDDISIIVTSNLERKAASSSSLSSFLRTWSGSSLSSDDDDELPVRKVLQVSL